MNSIIRNVVLLIGVFFVSTCCCSCSGNNIDNPNVVLMSKWAGYDKSITDTTLFASCKTVKLAQKDDIVVSNVDKILSIEDHFFLFDFYNCKIFVFDNYGRIVGKIDRRGHGPGEYLKIFDATYDAYSKQIMVL